MYPCVFWIQVAIEGCCHGELDNIYATLAHLEKVEGKKVDLLICCGDFQVSMQLLTFPALQKFILIQQRSSRQKGYRSASCCLPALQQMSHISWSVLPRASTILHPQAFTLSTHARYSGFNTAAQAASSCCFALQAVRNLDDLETMSVPVKYRHIMTFYKYYKGEANAPIPTIFSE